MFCCPFLFMPERRVKGLNRTVKLNIGLFVFFAVFCFICYSAYSNFKKNSVNFYEVVEGGMARENEHKGIAIRNESVQYADKAGYVNLFVYPGKRVGVGTELYAIDETGAMNNYLASNSFYDFTLSDENISKLKKNLNTFSAGYSDNNFASVYTTKAFLNTTLIDYASYADSAALEEAMANAGISYSKVTSPVSGDVTFDIDGYEGISAEEVTLTDFEDENYKETSVRSGQLIEKDSPVCRIVTDETWDIVFPLTEEEREQYASLTEMNIVFKGTDIKTKGAYSQLNSLDGTAYGKITLSKYMVDFISDRFLSFEVETSATSGLKIPKSAVVTKTFLLVPQEYLAHGGDDTGEGFYKEVLSDTGTTVQYIPTEIYYSNDEYFYVDFSSEAELQPGDYVVMPGSQEKFKLGATASRDGVYNINKGYAVFKQIDVIDSNDEYYTIRKNQKYGLSVYDHILFDPTGVNEGDFIYQ